MRMYGWNGKVISIENYKENNKDYSLEMELGCEVKKLSFNPALINFSLCRIKAIVTFIL